MSLKHDKSENKLSFRPMARMVKILGEHLIRDNTVGLMELIKNGYDADATLVSVSVENIRNPQKTTIVVEDNGYGMTEEIIKGPWFQPGHGGKEKAKLEQIRTKKGRLNLGEKGVGRFATQKLGKKLELVTRPEGSEYEYYFHINWDAFENTDKFMDQIKHDLVKRKPNVFTGKNHGTKITTKECRIPWKKRDLEKLRASLIRLLAPSETVRDFKVILKCPEFPEIESLETSDIIEKYQFKITCSIDDKGYAQYIYYQRTPEDKVTSRTGRVNLWSKANPDTWDSTVPSCGAFKVTISAWLLPKSKDYGISKEQLKMLSGMSIYRDGFRILPYGDEGDDWLGLDLRRVNAPATKYSNNQIIGTVEINQTDNPQLIDKTNREGLQENQEYFDLNDLVVGVLSLLEQESFEQRELEKPQVKKQNVLEQKNRDLEQKLESLGSELQKIKESEALTLTDKEKGTNDEINKDIVPVPAEKINALQLATQQLKEEFTAKAKEERILFEELSEMKEEKMESFLHLLGIGLAAERFSHEFDSLVNLVSRDVEDISRGTHNERTVHHLDMCINSLKNEVALMGICRFIRRGQNGSEVSVTGVLDTILKAYEREFNDAYVNLTFTDKNDFQIFMSEASLAQVFNNIISNALYWLKQKSERDKRKIQITMNAEEQSVTIVNSGARILPNVKKYLFHQPFITNKIDGRGLGMFISASILGKNNAEIRALDDSDPENIYGGAGFKLQFHKKPEPTHTSV